MSSNSVLSETDVQVMVGEDIISFSEFGLSLLKLCNDELVETVPNGQSQDEVRLWLNDLIEPVFVYDSSVREAYQIEHFLFDENRLILFSIDKTFEEIHDEIQIN